MPKNGLKRSICMAGRCYYCGCQLAIELTVDHLIPLSRGGTWERANLVCSCILCNLSKGSMTEAEFRQEVRARGFPWMRPEQREHFELRRANFIRDRESQRRIASAQKEARKAAAVAQRIENLELLLTYLELMFDAETEPDETIRSCTG